MEEVDDQHDHQEEYADRNRDNYEEGEGRNDDNNGNDGITNLYIKQLTQEVLFNSSTTKNLSMTTNLITTAIYLPIYLCI